MGMVRADADVGADAVVVDAVAARAATSRDRAINRKASRADRARATRRRTVWRRCFAAIRARTRMTTRAARHRTMRPSTRNHHPINPRWMMRPLKMVRTAEMRRAKADASAAGDAADAGVARAQVAASRRRATILVRAVDRSAA